ncbi:MAG: phosphate ABC transporter substrate-binding protein [Candidatus Margulisiibacteriota bacterium]
MRKTSLCLFILIALVCLIPACSRSHKALQIKGSDTMVNLAQVWAEEFMKKYPAASMAVTGGGSGTGIAALISQATDIAMTSRDMSKKEIEAAQSYGVSPQEYRVAQDGIAVVVSKKNPISQLTLQQLSAIFTGEYKNWKELGGQNARMVALSRDRNSGTHVFFLEKVVKLGDKKSVKEFGSAVLMMPSNQAIVEEVSGNPSAVGYIGLGYLTNKLKVVAVAKDEYSRFIVPTNLTVADGTYPIARPLNFYTDGVPSGEVKTFLDFVLSPAGQKIVLEMDFVPIK